MTKFTPYSTTWCDETFDLVDGSLPDMHDYRYERLEEIVGNNKPLTEGEMVEVKELIDLYSTRYYMELTSREIEEVVEKAYTMLAEAENGVQS